MRTRYRIIAVSAVAGVAVTTLAAPALAHVEVNADKSQAGATNVTLTFNGESENPKAGIRSERVVLPAGIAPADVTLVSAPAGWKFTSAADGFTVAGKALKIGTDAVWKVKIAKLPDGQTRLSFKTLETYGNGDVSRWIEIQQVGQAEPDNPAPLLTLKPGTAPASPSASASLSPSPSPSSEAVASPAPATTGARAQTPVASSSGSTWWIWVVIAVLAVIAGVLFLVRRRRSSSTE